MHVVVCVKRTVNVSQLMPHPGTGAPQLELVPYQISDFDENALEEAARLKEKHGGRISVLTMAPSDPKEVVLKALAFGADEAFAVVDERVAAFDSLSTAIVLAALVRRHAPSPDLVFCGEGSADEYNCQLGPRLAEELGIPCVTHAESLEVEGRQLRVKRSSERWDEELTCYLPAVVTVGSETNSPRHIPLLKAMASSRKPYKKLSLAELDVPASLGTGITTLKVSGMQGLRKRIVFRGAVADSVRQLVDRLLKVGALE